MWRLSLLHESAVVQSEVVAQLQKLLRFRTVNPPGNELALAQYLRDTLVSAGVEASLVNIGAERAAVLGKIRGSGRAEPLLLVAHMDVVDVELDKWSVDPFGGEIRDGYVYGRGAIDDKGMLAANLVTMLLLARDIQAGGEPPSRDVVFLATPDEETGGSQGMAWLVEHHPELLRAEFAINEGGRIRIEADGSRKLLLQNAEKIAHIVTFTAHGHAGHAGVPRADNSILRVGRALARISNFASDPWNGVSPTILSGGSKYNVIPGEASVLLNIRTRPGESIDVIVAELTRLIDDPELSVEIQSRGEDAPSSPPDSALFQAISDAARSLDPEIVVEPYLSNGITDSARLRKLGVKAYGILPFPLGADDEGRMHGHDERVPVDALGFGTRLIYEAVRRVAFASPAGALN